MRSVVSRDRRSPQPNLQFGPPDQSLAFWGVILATGVAAGFAGACLLRLLHLVERLAWPAYRGPDPDFLRAVEHASAARRIAVLGIAAVLAGVVRLLLSRRKTRGHGGDVVEAIWLGSGLISPLRTLANSLLSIVVVGLGASLGREGGIKHAGAAFASQFSVWGKLTPAERRLAVACGAGAGMAAAYNVPFGGALFAMEVLLGTLALPQVIPALVASLTATATSWVLLPNAPIYPTEIYRITPQEIAWALVAGPLLGLAGVYFIRAIAWADAQTHKGWHALVAPMIALVGIGVVSLLCPEILGNGKDVVRGAYLDSFPLSLLLVLPFLRLAASAGCLAGGVPGGLFTPTMACGALLSALLAHGALPLAGPAHLSVQACAVMGSGAFLAAATEGPVSSTVLLLELTRHIQGALVPLMLAIAGATLTTRALESRSIYSARIRVRSTGEVERNPKSRPLPG